ncbi:MAG: 4-hydroxy-tetrahydrodipicolinate synthase [Clostridiales bacterium]|nr:4-hydroxy-tetrahydrodipicolinate synthase [Clostridiales bacterium]
MKTPLFVGSGVAIVTPFREGDYSIDFNCFEKLIDFQIENGTDAIIVCGTTGEASTQSTEEHLQTIEHCVKHVNGRVPVIAGTGSNDTLYGIEMSIEARKLGVDGLLVVTPYYNKTTQKGLINHMTLIADKAGIPIIVYNVPSRTGMDITADTYCELAKHPLINGVKEASGNLPVISAVRQRVGDDLYFWSGEDNLVVPILSLGGKGVISVVGNIAPRQTSDMCRLYLEGNVLESTKIQIGLTELINSLFAEVNPVPVKAALKLMGLDSGTLRLPLIDISEPNLKRSMNAMTEYGLLPN